MAEMTRRRIRHIPVLEDGQLAGIVSIGDVVKNRLGEVEMEATVLREAYIAAH
jgi:signal-transduction protein with cAMP-binding, CBS, and nucleotidyltransferase domain